MSTTNGKLAVRLIRLTNIGGTEGTLEIPLGDITYLEGTNGAGKSSAMDGVAALCGAPVLDLLNQNAEEGEVYLELTDGTWFRRELTREGKNTLTAGHPDQGRIGRAAAWLKSTLSAASLSPAEFLKADDAQAAEYLLRAAPLTVTVEEVVEAIGDAADAGEIDVAGHALRVLDGVAKRLYDERTEQNRAAKQAQTTIDQLQGSIPDDVRDPQSLAEVIADLEAELDGITQECETAEKAAAHAARAEVDAELQEVNKAVAHHGHEVIRLKAELEAEEKALTSARERRDVLVTQRDARAEEAEQAAGVPFAERMATAKAELTAARQAHESATKAQAAVQNTRKMIDQLGKAAERARERSQALTAAMARLDALKAAKAADLPVEGATIQDGRLCIDGVPWHRVNTADQISAALDASTAQDTRIRFVFADDLEHLSTKTRHEVEEACRRRGIQVLGARVTDDEKLTVRAAPGPDPDQAGLEF